MHKGTEKRGRALVPLLPRTALAGCVLTGQCQTGRDGYITDAKGLAEPPTHHVVHSANPSCTRRDAAAACEHLLQLASLQTYYTSKQYEVDFGFFGCFGSHGWDRISDDGVQRQSTDAPESISFAVRGRLAPSALGESKVRILNTRSGKALCYIGPLWRMFVYVFVARRVRVCIVLSAPLETTEMRMF